MLMSKKWSERNVCILTSFAAGVLIEVAVLDLLPEAFEMGEANLVSITLLVGMIFLFVLEKSSVWIHSHHREANKTEVVGVFLGDTLHNFIDGLAIGAAFLISVPTGIATALAVGMHELPQEIADFSLYIRAGFGRLKTIVMNLFSSFATLVGALIVYFFGGILEGAEIYMLALTAGMFLYIALADLLPELHEHKHKKRSAVELMVFLGAIIISYFSMGLVHDKVHNHEYDHNEEIHQEVDYMSGLETNLVN